jgi:valyl-tRNA synthetase
LERGETKLGNTEFVNRAPAEVVAKERERVADMRHVLARLEEQLQRMQRL